MSKEKFSLEAKGKSLLMQIADGTRSSPWRKLFQFTCNIVRINYQQLNPQLISFRKQGRKRKKNIFSSFLRFRNVWEVSSDLVMQISVLQSIMIFHFFFQFSFFSVRYCCTLKRRNKEADEIDVMRLNLKYFFGFSSDLENIFLVLITTSRLKKVITTPLHNNNKQFKLIGIFQMRRSFFLHVAVGAWENE